MSRVVKPISLKADEHQLLLEAAADVGITLKELVESIILLFMATVKRGDPVKFRVPQKVHAPKPYAISRDIVVQVKQISEQHGVSQVNFIYSAMMWHLSSKNGVSA